MNLKKSTINQGSSGSNQDIFSILFLLFLAFILFLPNLFSLMSVWNSDPDYSHGYFVIPICGYMIWQKKDQLLNNITSVWWWALPIFVFFVILYVVAYLSKFNTLANLTFIMLIISLLLFVSGRKFTSKLIAPIFFLLFMFPIPTAYYILITNPLKLMITEISADIIDFIGITVYQEGNLLFFSNTQLEVAEACSGIRSLYSYIMLSCIFAMLCRRLDKKIIMIVAAIPLAIVVNIIRVSGTGVLSHYYGEKVAQGFFHEFTGFIVFALGFILLYLIFILLNYQGRFDAK